MEGIEGEELFPPSRRWDCGERSLLVIKIGAS